VLAQLQSARCARCDLGNERAAYIGRVRNLARVVAQVYFDAREKLGFPM